MMGRFKQSGYVDPIYGVDSLRNQALVEFYCNKYVMNQNEVSPTITQEDIDAQKLDPFKNFSKVMRKRNRDHTTRNRVNMHYYALEELEKRSYSKSNRKKLHG